MYYIKCDMKEQPLFKDLTIGIYTYYFDISHRGIFTKADLRLGQLISPDFHYSQFREGILQGVIQIRRLTFVNFTDCPPKSIIL